MRGGGEIVEVQGGHIVRATGRKDRHSKVCTAKGPRDRRVRLAAHTAIQFYDVQDRLGYDRPSKAVDWLIMNAKAAIDELAPLPAWQPTNQVDSMGDSGKRPVVASEPDPDPEPEPDPVVSTTFRFGETSRGSGSSFLPSSMDSDSIADTIKSFFPMSAVPAAPSPSSTHPVGVGGVGGVGVSGYHGYPQDLLSRSSSQELRLSLQSFQDQIFHHQHHRNDHDSLVFDTPAPTGWPEQSQRMMVPWNLADCGNRGGYMFNTPPPPLPPPAVSLHGQFFTQRGPLQSSNSPSVRPWADPVPASADHPMFHPIASAIGFASGGDIGFSGFRIPARIQGEEEHDGISDNPSSASSASHH